MNRAALLCLLSGALCGCQDREARAENARLAARVAALEAEVETLTAEQPGADGDTVVMRAAAQHCANDLTRVLETLRQADGRYPAEAQLSLPEACLDLRISWRVLRPDAYRFGVSDARGRVLAVQSSP